MKKFSFLITFACFASLFSSSAIAADNKNPKGLEGLKNYQVNTATMLSAGLPSQQHFETLRSMGVTSVIDLIPGDRSEETALMSELNLGYGNIQVEWENPTLKNFEDYVGYMKTFSGNQGKVLTHCRLNWRGAVFTYLYRVTQLNESEGIAKQDMLNIWEPNETWQMFIDNVKAHYSQGS